jgi:hypothetical protein
VFDGVSGPGDAEGTIICPLTKPCERAEQQGIEKGWGGLREKKQIKTLTQGFQVLSSIRERIQSWLLVAHACNPRYLGG